MLTAIRRWIDRHQLIRQGDKIVVACSGGPDSLALLHILTRLRTSYQMELKAAYLNHMFRPEAAAEAQFVSDMAASWGVDCEHTAIDVPAYIAETGLSTQEAARIVRYRFLYRIAEEWGCAKIATGHHRDDQAETVLLHLLRGAGGAGIGGMRPINGPIIRPLLPISRQEIEDYCRENRLEPVQDSSNWKTDYLRNRIRLELIPMLEKDYNPSLRESLWRSAQIIGDEQEAIVAAAREQWSQAVSESKGHLSLAIAALTRLSTAVQRQLLRLLIEKKQGHVRGIQFVHVENLIEVARDGVVGTVLELPGGLRVERSYTELVFRHVAELPTAVQQPLGEITLTVPGRVVCGDWVITAELTDKRGIDSLSYRQALLDWEVLTPPLRIRARTPGDRIAPLGLAGNKKLKDIFIDAKVPQQERDAIPLVCDQEGIVWVAGLRQAERTRVTKATRRYLQLTLNKQGDSHAE